jgi:hypothetical protein
MGATRLPMKGEPIQEVEHDTAELERVADEGNYQTKKNLQIGIGKIGAFTQDRRMRFEQPGRRIIQPKTDPELDKDREIQANGIIRSKMGPRG